MLFVFRGIRVFQVLTAIGALGAGIGCAVLLKAASDGAPLYILLAIPAGMAFLWLFAAALRAPTSFVAVSEERTRIRFAGLIDTVVANSDIASVRLVRHALWRGIGVRTNLRGSITLASAPGTIAELDLRKPVRVWLIPGLWRVKTTRLGVSIRNPQKLAERFASPAHPSPKPATPRKMKARGPRTRQAPP